MSKFFKIYKEKKQAYQPSDVSVQLPNEHSKVEKHYSEQREKWNNSSI